MVNPFEIAAPTDRDEYWDGDFQDEGDDDDDEEDESDDEEAFDGRPAANGNGHPAAMNGNGHHAAHHKKKKMKKMKVSTHRDLYAEGAGMIMAMSPRARGICCFGGIGCLIIIIFIAWAIPSRSSSSALAGGEEEEPTCQVHTTQEPFSEWMHHIRRSNSTELCRPEVPESDCKCHNPFLASVDDKEGWHEVFDANLQALNATIEKGGDTTLDLVLYGDSIIERMNGRVFGKPVDEIQDQLKVTEEYFTKEGGGEINALPLGIAGEEIHALMYRLKNGEMPDTLKPGAWWLMIGTNDVVETDCDVDAVVAGVVTVAEEILRRDEINRHYDASHVVINSLFPRLTLYDDPLYETIQQINSRLECYAETTTGIEFFNATNLFLDEQTGSTVNTNMFLADGKHLTAHGLRIWEKEIVEKTLYLIDHNS